jgi:uncharacterized protein YdaU (DUF1376 family)
MFYYQFNIGDYATHTRHLSLMEDLAYRRLLDWYYLNEKPLPKDHKKVAKLILMNECLTDVEQVLNEFFECVEQGWINKRADYEILHFKDKQSKASKAGKASGIARGTGVERTLNGRATKQRNKEPNKLNSKPVDNSTEKTRDPEAATKLIKAFSESKTIGKQL